MKPITLRELQEVLAGAAEAITTPIRVTGATVGEYHKRLGHFSYELVSAAVDFRLTESPYFPTIDGIMQACRFLICRIMQIPSPAEAWAQVLAAKRFKPMVVCEAGAQLREKVSQFGGAQYLLAVRDYGDHVTDCAVCSECGMESVYDHEAVKMTVRTLGGYDALFTGSLAADRSRFIAAFEEVVDREVRLFTMPHSVKGFIASSQERMALTNGTVADLAKRMESPQKNRLVPPGYANSFVLEDGNLSASEVRKAAFDRGERF